MTLIYDPAFTGGDNDDIIIAYESYSGANTLNGGGGNDALYGDHDYFFSSQTNPNSIATASFMTDSASVWSLSENPDVLMDGDIPHTSAANVGNGTDYHYYRFDLVSGQVLFADIDHASFDTVLEVFASDGTTRLAYSDDADTGIWGEGSSSTRDSFLSFTAAFQGTYYVRVREFGSSPIRNGGQYILNFSLTGQSFDPTFDPTAGNDSLLGGSGNDTLYGMAGNDTLNGGLDVDRMLGGSGDDFYFVDNVFDEVVELGNAGDEDRVATNISYTLAVGAEIEVFTTTQSTGFSAINLTGNRLTQAIVGNNGANVLADGGGPAADVLTGRLGNDIYLVRNSNTLIVEGNGQGTSDRVATAVDFVLAADDNIEQMRTTSSISIEALNLTANALNQQIIGNDGANRINGMAGTDVITGRGGADVFVFTTALGAGNIDEITDYSVAADRIEIDNAVFAGLATGALPASQFAANTSGVATTAGQRIIYDTNGGQLYFDADGTGGGARVQFALLDAGLAMTAGEFLVI